jgi:hypothetical protein
MGIASEPDEQLVEEAAETYTAFLLEAYGFERADVETPDAYRGREVDWFGDLNDTLTELEDYAPPEVRRILTGRNPWVRDDESLLSLLRRGETREVRRILRRY